MKILLINPPKSPINLIYQYAAEDMKNKISKIGLIGPPHSLCSIAGNLTDFTVDILDLKAEYDLGLKEDAVQYVSQRINEFNPDIVGMTVITSDYNSAIKILKGIKKTNSKILTIVGGIHPSLCPEDFLLDCIDIIIKGVGKKIFRDIVEAYEKRYNLSKIPNIILRQNRNFYFTTCENLFSDKSQLLSQRYSNRSLIKKYDNAYKAGMTNEPMAFIETSLGCPSRCNFCTIWPVNGGNYFIRSIDDVIGELKTMKDYKVIRFVDAHTMGNVQYADALFDAIIKEKLDKVFVMDVRADTAVNHPNLIKKAAKAGLKAAIVGIESFDEKELDFYNKNLSQNTILKAIDVFFKNDVHVRGVCMVQPDYDDDKFYRLSSFLQKTGLEHSSFTVMTPVPGTQLYDQLKDKVTIKNLDYYNYFNSVFETRLPEEEFYFMTAELFRKQRVRV